MQVRVIRDVAAVRALVHEVRAAGRSVGFVPTMGNLHDGHLELARQAASRAGVVLMSIFVNPVQFGPAEDFGAYPRTLDQDLARMAATGVVAAAFVPEVADVYPFGTQDCVRITLPALSRELCGASRPGHFDGVATVVCRLLNIVAPDLLVLGQKDYQQFVLMQRMIKDLQLPVRVLCGPTVRESDGLAMSSRNRYLDSQQRLIAPGLNRVLRQVRDAVIAGTRDYVRLTRDAVAQLEHAGFRPDYVEVRRAADLAAADDEASEQLIVLGAAWLGRARLIDNVRVAE